MVILVGAPLAPSSWAQTDAKPDARQIVRPDTPAARWAKGFFNVRRRSRWALMLLLDPLNQPLATNLLQDERVLDLVVAARSKALAVFGSSCAKGKEVFPWRGRHVIGGGAQIVSTARVG